MRRRHWLAGTLATGAAAAMAARSPLARADEVVKELILPGESFRVDGKAAFIMWPEKRVEPQPWIFYAPTLPAYPDQAEKWMHERFLAAGVAVAGIDVGEAYGSPKGRAGYDAFYHEATTKRGLSKKPVLLGRSRGGLWSASWGAENVDKIAGLAGIYPVYDFRTYPKIPGAAAAYGMTAEELERRVDEFNPIARVHKMAKAKTPVFIIHGDMDDVVPLKENSATLLDVYKAHKADDVVELVVAKGQGHNFWEGFFRCERLVEFAIERAQAGAKE